MPENKSPRGEECSCVVLGGDVGDDGILDVNVAALRLRFRAERMLFVLEAPGEKASTKTMLVDGYRCDDVKYHPQCYI